MLSLLYSDLHSSEIVLMSADCSPLEGTNRIRDLCQLMAGMRKHKICESREESVAYFLFWYPDNVTPSCVLAYPQSNMLANRELKLMKTKNCSSAEGYRNAGIKFYKTMR